MAGNYAPCVLTFQNKVGFYNTVVIQYNINNLQNVFILQNTFIDPEMLALT